MAADKESTRPSDAVEQSGNDTPVAKQSSARTEPPTWTEVMQSRTKATTKDNKKSEKTKYNGAVRICVSQRFHVEVSEAGSKKALPIHGKLTCYELLHPRVAHAQLLERRQRSADQRGGWADVWYARWLLRMQLTTILGLEHMKKTQELMNIPGVQTLDAVRKVVAGDKERAAYFYVATLDQMMVKWPDNVAAFYRRMFTPNLNMGKRYVESWKNGTQQNMLSKFWDSAVNLSGVKLAAMAFSNMAKAWDKENGGDKKED
ncbi:hypothetical protein GGI20_004527 [Coemansia sp. BCRC 34301]|nr:hypothetical protein GGI20_004527 [Coemansia sp. BCRC 34301]